jgi:hypothetical protein
LKVVTTQKKKFLDQSVISHDLTLKLLQSLAFLSTTNSSFLYCDFKTRRNFSKSSVNVLVHSLEVHYPLLQLLASGGQAITLLAVEASKHAIAGEYAFVYVLCGPENQISYYSNKHLINNGILILCAQV